MEQLMLLDIKRKVKKNENEQKPKAKRTKKAAAIATICWAAGFIASFCEWVYRFLLFELKKKWYEQKKIISDEITSFFVQCTKSNRFSLLPLSFFFFWYFLSLFLCVWLFFCLFVHIKVYSSQLVFLLKWSLKCLKSKKKKNFFFEIFEFQCAQANVICNEV